MARMSPCQTSLPVLTSQPAHDNIAQIFSLLQTSRLPVRQSRRILLQADWTYINFWSSLLRGIYCIVGCPLGEPSAPPYRMGLTAGPSLWLKVLSDKYHINVWVIVMMIIIIAILGILKIVKILIILLKLRAFDHYIEKNIFHSWGRSLNVGICCLDLLVNPYNNE